MAEQKEVENNKMNRFMDSFYAEKVIGSSAKELADEMTKHYGKNIVLESSSHHNQKSDIIINKGKENVYNYLLSMFKKFQASGWNRKITLKKINGFEAHVEGTWQFLDCNGKLIGAPIKIVEKSKLNIDGECIYQSSITEDYNITNIIQKEYIYKCTKDDDKIMVCLDEDYNDCKFPIDNLSDELMKKINNIIKEGEEQTKDVTIIVNEKKKRNEGLSEFVVFDAKIV